MEPAPLPDAALRASWHEVLDLFAEIYAPAGQQALALDQARRVLQETVQPSLIAMTLARGLDQEAEFISAPGTNFPALIWGADREPMIVLGQAAQSGRFQALQWQGGDAREETLSARDIRKIFAGGVIFHPRATLFEEDHAATMQGDWLKRSIAPLWGGARAIAIAALVGNSLSVLISLFSMQVWDRVVPAQSTNTLTVLVIGVVAATLLEMVLRNQRALLIDELGKSVDASMSAEVFSHVLYLKSDKRPANLGSLAAQVRELQQIRETMSSSVVSAAIDMPFLLIFVVFIYVTAGPLVVPILVAIPLVILLGLIVQIPLGRLAKIGLQEAAAKNAMIVESVLKADSIKLLAAEQTMMARWNHSIEVTNDTAAEQRKWRSWLMAMTQTAQQLSYVAIVAMGAVAILKNQLTMGQVIACSILANRAVAPLSQLSVVLGALQSTKQAKISLDDLMARATDAPAAKTLRRDLRKPSIELVDMSYEYPGSQIPALADISLTIAPGERVALIGPIGSGKSSLLRVLSGLATITHGTHLIAGSNVNDLNNSDLRAAIGFMSQSTVLFKGTLRDNLKIANPSANDEDMLTACTISGAHELILNNPRGLDVLVNDAGHGLSGGQTQSILFAREVLRNPAILLLDEPTSAMDDASERRFVQQLDLWAGDRTLVIATHRPALLAPCTRIVVLRGGKIVLDGPKDEVLARLGAPKAVAHG